MADFELEATPRAELGTGAMRRLRRMGRIPGILYGAGKDPRPISLSARLLRKQLENEAFSSHIIAVKVKGEGEDQAVVKALQRHPATSEVVHLDLLRISASQKLAMTVPLHFENESEAPGARMGGVFAHHMVEVEISCLPGDLPEYITVYLGMMELGDSIHLSAVLPPDGVELTALAHGNDPMVVSLALPRAVEEETEEEGEGEEEFGEAPEADGGAAPAAEGDAEE